MKTRRLLTAGIFTCIVSIFSVDLAYGRWLQPDPHAENYYSTSPYAFSLNNPVRYIDPDGRDVWEIDYSGNVQWIEESELHTMHALNQQGQRTGNSITVNDRSIFDGLATARDSKDYRGNYAITGSHEVGDVFLFAAKNTNVEWSLDGYQGESGRQYVIRTTHEDRTSGVRNNSGEGLTMANQYFTIHSHPAMDGTGTRGGSGYGPTYRGDMALITDRYHQATTQGIPLPTHYVYHKQSQTIYQYTPWNPSIYIKQVNNNQGMRFIVPQR